MQTVGTVLLAVKRCSIARVRMPARDGRSAHRLLYLAAVRGGICPPMSKALRPSTFTQCCLPRRRARYRLIHQHHARVPYSPERASGPLLPRTRDARISGFPGAPPARERSASGSACVGTSPGRPAAGTCRRSHRSSADNVRRWACALLHDSAARVLSIRPPPFNSSTCRLPRSTRVQVPVDKAIPPSRSPPALLVPGISRNPGPSSWTQKRSCRVGDTHDPLAPANLDRLPAVEAWRGRYRLPWRRPPSL